MNEFTEDQNKAIESVERAMKKLERSGLVLAGVDDGLLVFRLYDYGGDGGFSFLNDIEYCRIECPYVGSGGM
jgi:hypothetical protein